MEVLVSVIIPIFNAEKTLNYTLNSIMNQKYKSLEIICIDDGSTDNSIQILQMMRDKDKRIKILQQENHYAGVARNKGMEIAKGKYLIFLDSDDYFYDNMIVEMVDLAEKTNADVTICDAVLFDKKTNKIIKTDYILNTQYLSDVKIFSPNEKKDDLFNITTTAPWNKLYLRSYVIDNNLRFQDTKTNNDIYFSCLSLVFAKRITYINSELMEYHINNNESLQGKAKNKYKDFIFAVNSTYEFLIKNNECHIYINAFKKLCVSFIINNLSRIDNYNDYITYYQEVRKRIITNIIDDVAFDKNQEYYAERYSWFISSSPNEYLFKMLQYSIGRDIDLCKTIDDLERDINTFINNDLKKKWRFPYEKVEKDSIVVLYGAGNVGKDLFNEINGNNYCKVIAWIDKDYERIGDPVKSPNILLNIAFDIVLIAVINDNVCKEIYNSLIELGIGKSKIIMYTE